MLLDICLGSKAVWRILLVLADLPGRGVTREEIRKFTKLGSKSLTDSLKTLIETARKKNPKGTSIEIEVTNIAEFNEALPGKPDIIMLDNMSIEDVKACVEIRRLSKFKPLLEASGGITLENVEEYAKTRVDMISVGSLTNSVKAIDMSLEIV